MGVSTWKLCAVTTAAETAAKAAIVLANIFG